MSSRFILEPYKGINSRHSCPECNHKKCFSRYIDTDDRIKFPTYVGRCNREEKCGYHFTPKAYFEENPNQHERSVHKNNREQESKPKAISYLSYRLVEQSMSRYETNKFYQFLSSLIGEKGAFDLMSQYKVGTAKHWKGATVFWQIDSKGKVHTGKIMLYDNKTGKRIKHPYNHITWAHSLLHNDNFNLKQCFFGEHLLSTNKTRTIAIVESEKTAIIASYYLPQYIWLATGGKNGCFREESFKILKGRKVILFPDIGATEYWDIKKSLMTRVGITVCTFDYLECYATKEQGKEGNDIADYLVRNVSTFNNKEIAH